MESCLAALRPGLLCLALLVASVRAQAQEATPLSASPFKPGQFSIAVTTGFPYAVNAQAAVGLVPRFDLTVIARAAWADVQRFGVEGRIRLTDPSSPRGFALKLGADSWAQRPPNGNLTWLNITGLQDVTFWANGVFSWTTPRGTVMSTQAGVELVGTREPPEPPLAGTPPLLTFGPNITVRAAAEIPFRSGLRFLFDLGVDIHLNGFDSAEAMPEVSVGLSYAL